MTIPSAQTVQRPAKKTPSGGTALAAGVVVLLMAAFCIGGIAYYVFGGHGDSSSKAPADRSLEAKSMCETFVKRQLKAPATAKFSEESAAKVSDVEYTAAGSVDSQNSFGAMLRSTFACDLTYDAAKQEWTSRSVSVR